MVKTAVEWKGENKRKKNDEWRKKGSKGRPEKKEEKRRKDGEKKKGKEGRKAKRKTL